MANNSTYTKIMNLVTKSERGTLFFPDSFNEFGTSDAVRSALVRLCEAGILMRVAKGIYCYPKVDKWGGGAIPPSIDEIAAGIAARDKVRIAQTGMYALYQLGLSTQVPANVVFITDGSPRRVSIGNGRGILFKHTSEMRTFAYKSKLMAMIVAAMRELGEGHLSDDQLKLIKARLNEIPTEEYLHDVSLAPIWVRKTLREK